MALSYIATVNDAYITDLKAPQDRLILTPKKRKHCYLVQNNVQEEEIPLVPQGAHQKTFLHLDPPKFGGD